MAARYFAGPDGWGDAKLFDNQANPGDGRGAGARPCGVFTHRVLAVAKVVRQHRRGPTYSKPHSGIRLRAVIEHVVHDVEIDHRCRPAARTRLPSDLHGQRALAAANRAVDDDQTRHPGRCLVSVWASRNHRANSSLPHRSAPAGSPALDPVADRAPLPHRPALALSARLA